MVSYLLDTLNISTTNPTSRQPTPGSRSRTPATSRRKVVSKRKEERREQAGQSSGGEERLDSEPRWQVAVDKPRFI